MINCVAAPAASVIPLTVSHVLPRSGTGLTCARASTPQSSKAKNNADTSRRRIMPSSIEMQRLDDAIQVRRDGLHSARLVRDLDEDNPVIATNEHLARHANEGAL